jgi:hypothetical protein
MLQFSFLLVPANNIVPSLPIRVTLMIDDTRSSETSILPGAKRCNISEGYILFESKMFAYFLSLLVNLYNNQLLSLIRQFFITPERVGNFMELRP